jgi:serine/threonine protein kinase
MSAMNHQYTTYFKEVDVLSGDHCNLDKHLPHETSIMKSLRHPHIINVHNTIDIREQVYIYMEICI